MIFGKDFSRKSSYSIFNYLSRISHEFSTQPKIMVCYFRWEFFSCIQNNVGWFKSVALVYLMIFQWNSILKPLPFSIYKFKIHIRCRINIPLLDKTRLLKIRQNGDFMNFNTAHKAICKRCGMPIENNGYGTNIDGSSCQDYCLVCYQHGCFTKPDITMAHIADQMANILVTTVSDTETPWRVLRRSYAILPSPND